VPGLFDPLTLRGTTFKNRVWVAPMCQYAAGGDGLPTPYHLAHYGQFALGGAALIITEATAVEPAGRLTPADVGLWADEQVAAWRPTVDFMHEAGSLAAVQLVHAGRKASAAPPWQGGVYLQPADGGWPLVGASPIAFEGWPAPAELTPAQLADIVANFAAAAARAHQAGFDVVELHAAHGYLLHQFLSPLSNHRADDYGGDFAGRTRLLLEVLDAVRAQWPDDAPVLVRLSATEWVDGGWTADDTVALAPLLAAHGADLIDCSSGGNVHDAKIPMAPGYQVPFAARVRRETGVPASAVGLITEARHANAIIAAGDADAVLLARELLRNPHWPLLAAAELDPSAPWPVRYVRARP